MSGAAHAPHAYRADIDGLRAVAVLAVVLFHAHAPFITGGYVGVDVFFVISGFLITSLISREIERGEFSIVTFYERRVRRILPAFFAVVLASFVAAWFVLLPSAFMDFAESALAATAFSSNILFFREADYFAAPAHLKPLLHTWSLAVEEQFYLVFPLLLLALRRRTRLVIPLLVVLFVVTLVACVWATSSNPDVGRQTGAAAAFYLSPFRGWQLLTGSLLALGTVPPIARGVVREAAAATGLALILAASFLYDERTPFPGSAALAPTLGAALLIHAGTGGLSLVGRLLASRPAVFIGKISYSLYLWHWPVLVLGTIWSLEPLTGTARAGLVALSLVLAVLSWRFVEQPFRERAVGATRKALFVEAATATALVLVLVLGVSVTRGFPARIKPEALALHDARKDSNPDRKRCHADDKHPIGIADKCVYGVKGARPRVAIWGDSFAAELAVALGHEAERRGESLLYVSWSACPPALGLFDDRPRCEDHNRALVDWLGKHADIETVVVIARYEAYESTLPHFHEAFARAVNALADAGKRVVVSWPVPRPHGHVPTLLGRAAQRGIDPHAVSISRAKVDADNAATVAALERLLRPARVVPARVADVLCDATRCPLMTGEDVVYFDDVHLSLRGAERAAPAFTAAFDRQ